MKTKQDYQQAIAAAISNYPVAAQFYQVRDPRLLAALDAMATMLALLSSEQDVAAMEPFTKARDMTVLADAAVKGVLPFGQAKRVKVKIVNSTTTAFSVVSGRRLLDTQGRMYVVDTGGLIPASDFQYVEALQKSETSFDHTVTVGQPFYRIDVPKPEEGRFIASVRVIDADSNEFEYIPDYNNVGIGDKMFHLETDETQQLYIQFGASGLAGYQPEPGEVFTVTIVETEGDFDIAIGSQFAFEYAVSLYEAGAILTLDAVLDPGALPMDIATLREVTSYPSVYDSSAVFLGNFDFLIRRNLSPFEFLSVWNEHMEESVRGPSVDNINHLFVAGQKDGVDAPTLQASMEAVILAADDSYKVTHVDIIEEEIGVDLIAYVSAVYDFGAVEQQIRELVLAEYGQESVWSKRGGAKIQYKRLYDLLTTGVQSLQGSGSDMRATVTYSGNDDGENKTGKAYTRSSTTVTVVFVAHNFLVGDALVISEATDADVNGNIVITTAAADQFTFETAAVGADGTLTVKAVPRPEKWRYVSEGSLTVTVLQAS